MGEHTMNPGGLQGRDEGRDTFNGGSVQGVWEGFLCLSTMLAGASLQPIKIRTNPHHL
jgi:hypothetical protein